MTRNGAKVAVIVLALCGQQAAAQFPRYQPPGGPVLPRELDYFRQDTGVLDNYNAFIAPRRQLDQTLKSMQAKQQTDARDAQRSIALLKESVVAPTGTGASYMNYSHYYNIPRSGFKTPVR
jgi:hypothetical protein